MRQLILSFSAILLILCASAVVSLPQKHKSHGLVLTGSVGKIGAKCINGKATPEVTIHLQFRNDSDGTILVFAPFWVFTRRIEFINGLIGATDQHVANAETFAFNPYLTDPHGPVREDDFDPMPLFLKRIDAPKPSAFITAIEPGRYFEFTDLIWPKSGFKLESMNGKPKFECSKTGTIERRFTPEHLAFKIEYKLSLKKIDGGTDLLERLQERWKSVGLLVLDSEGDFTYKSNEIVFESVIPKK